MTVYIYKILCVENNRVYIGQTKNPNRRWRQHKSDLKLNKHRNKNLQYDYNVYGLNDFKFSIIETCCAENVLDVETYYINYYGGKNSSNVYNELDIHGESDLMINHISKSMTGNKLSSETKLKISKAITGRIPYNKDTSKYSNNIINALREDYNNGNTLKQLSVKYDICMGTISNLIRFGTTSSSKLKLLRAESKDE